MILDRSIRRRRFLPGRIVAVRLFVWMVAIAVQISGLGCAEEIGTPDEKLRFVRSGGIVSEASLARLRSVCPPTEIAVDDPYHEKRMRYFAFAFRCVLDLGFADSGGSESLRGQGLLLRALDGYTRPAAGSELLGRDVWLAYGEVGRMQSANDEPAFSPIDRRQVDPAPFYLVWSGVEQNDPHTHPWPYQLATIEVASFESSFPHTVPDGLAAADAGWRGYSLFQASCASCHAINGEGGRIGPDLNIPTSIVEYRPIEQIRSYIRNPQATRYTNMPPHPEFTSDDLDALIAYFEAMRTRKHDVRGGEAE